MGWYTILRVIHAPFAHASIINIPDQIIFTGMMNLGTLKLAIYTFFAFPNLFSRCRHVRVHHPDKTNDDPMLRSVLAQRPNGSARGRKRRLDLSDEQNISGEQPALWSSDRRERQHDSGKTPPTLQWSNGLCSISRSIVLETIHARSDKFLP